MKKLFAMMAVLVLAFGVLAPAASAGGYIPCTAFTGYINGYRINIRSGPGTSNPVCGIAMCGEPFYVTAQSYCSGGRLWYYGTIGLVAGWIYSGYVCGAPVPAPVAVTACALPCSVVYVLMDSTNFRSGPGLGYSSILQLNSGTVLQLTGAVRDFYGTMWYQAQVSGLVGWIRSDLVSAGAPASPVSSCFTGYTNPNAVNVRLTPNGTKIAQLRRGTVVYVTGVVCQWGVYWYQVSFWGSVAYIRADLVSPAGGYGVVPATGYGVVVPGVGTCPAVGTAVPVPGGNFLYSAPQSVQPAAGQTVTPDISGTVPGVGAVIPGAAGAEQSASAAYPETPASQPAAPSAGTGHMKLSFSTFDFTPGQTLPVYTAPDPASVMADSGTAMITVNGRVWVAGYDGQWLLVMYQNSQMMTRVGYVNAFQLQGTLPDVPSLAFSGTVASVVSRTALTSDPMEKTDTLMMLSSGDSVTWLADLDMNGEWAYVEVTAGGAAVRGFVPRSALR